MFGRKVFGSLVIIGMLFVVCSVWGHDSGNHADDRHRVEGYHYHSYRPLNEDTYFVHHKDNNDHGDDYYDEWSGSGDNWNLSHVPRDPDVEDGKAPPPKDEQIPDSTPNQANDPDDNPLGQNSIDGKGNIVVIDTVQDSDYVRDSPPDLPPCSEGKPRDVNGNCPDSPVVIIENSEESPQPSTPTPDTSTTSRSRSSSISITPDMTRSEVSDTVERLLQGAIEDQEDVPDKLPDSEEEMEEEVVELVYHADQWYKGYNLVSFPVLPSDIVTIADFYHRYSFFNSPQDFIMAKVDGCFLAYNGENNNAVGDLEITPYLGVVMLHDWSVYLGLHGVPVVGDGVLEIEAGTHLVGLSEIPEGFTKPSDFLSIPHIDFVVTRTTPKVVELPTWHTIGREGDPGDEHPLYVGQAVLLVVEERTEIVFREDVAAAPGVRRGVFTMTWGEVKQGR